MGDLQRPAYDGISLFDELPAPTDGVSSYDGQGLNSACAPLADLIGIWRGQGEVDYATMDRPRRFAIQLAVAHDGRAFLSHESRAWLLDDSGAVVRPAAREVGWWRPRADGTVEFLLAHITGITEVFVGGPAEGGWVVSTDSVVTTATAKTVESARRTYRIVENSGRVDLLFDEERAMVGLELQPHLTARLTRR